MKVYDIDGNEIDPSELGDSKMDQILQKLEQSDDSNAKQLAKLLGDSEVLKIIEAREKGEAVKVNVGSEKDPPVEGDPPVDIDLDDMTPKQLAAHVKNEVMGAVKTEIADAITPVKGSLDTLNKTAVEIQQETNKKEWNRILAIDPELETYKPKMLELNKTNPNLNFVQLYQLASGKTLENVKKPDTFSERPTPAAPPTKKTRKVPLSPGRKGFNELLAESKGVEKALAEHQQG